MHKSTGECIIINNINWVNQSANSSIGILLTIGHSACIDSILTQQTSPINWLRTLIKCIKYFSILFAWVDNVRRHYLQPAASNGKKPKQQLWLRKLVFKFIFPFSLARFFVADLPSSCFRFKQSGPQPEKPRLLINWL